MTTLRFATIALLSLAAPVLGQEEEQPPEETSPLARIAASVREVTFPNGWTFLVVPRPGAPIVSFETYVDVGSIHEQPGRTGLAHMFEHMAFKGSDRIGSKDWRAERTALDVVERRHQELVAARASGDEDLVELARLAFVEARTAAGKLVDVEAFGKKLEDAGGAASLNAYTTAEEMRFVVSLPSTHVELWCWLEAERFQRSVLREFYTEREAVMEERRMRVESNPMGLLLEQLQLNAFLTHPYRNPVIGYADDIASFSRTEAEHFFLQHYGARNLTTAIVGDVDPETLLPMLERYFARVPAGAERAPVTVREAAQKGERRVEVSFPANPLLALAWHVPGLTHKEYPAIEIALRVLGHTRNSRLVNRLVRQDGSAAELDVAHGWPGNRFENLAVVIAVPMEGFDTTTLESAVYEELTRLLLEGPGQEELDAVKRVARAEFLRSVRDHAELASMMTEYQAKTGSWENAFARLDALESVTSEDVKRIISKYFTASNRTVATLVSPASEEDG